MDHSRNDWTVDLEAKSPNKSRLVIERARKWLAEQRQGTWVLNTCFVWNTGTHDNN